LYQPESKVSPAGLFGIDKLVSHLPADAEQTVVPTFCSHERTTELIIGERNLRALIPAIRELRLRCGQQDDFTTDLQYFIAANTQKNRKVAAVLIRRNGDLEACVLFIEHCRFGLSLGLWRGGDTAGDGLVAGPQAFRVHYVHLAAQALLRRWRIYGVSFAVKASFDDCIEVMGPKNQYRMFRAGTVQRELPLESTYRAMLAGMGPRTRRSLDGKRRQLEARSQIALLPSLDPDQALEAMLRLQQRSMPNRTIGFYKARHRLLREIPDFFCMGMHLPDGQWLSLLSGWRRNRVTYIDLQMNDKHFRRESLSAVMRAFMLEHEIACKQQLIHFVGGTSLLLRRYCQPSESYTDAFLSRPCLRATLFHMMVPWMNPKSLYKRVKTGPNDRSSDHP
jgi:hypothetical protein